MCNLYLSKKVLKINVQGRISLFQDDLSLYTAINALFINQSFWHCSKADCIDCLHSHNNPVRSVSFLFPLDRWEVEAPRRLSHTAGKRQTQDSHQGQWVSEPLLSVMHLLL